MNIALPESLGPLVDRRVKEGGFESPEAYLAALVEADAFGAWWATLTPEEQAAHEETDRLLDAAVASGPAVVADEAWLAAKLQRLRDRRAIGAAGPNPS